MISLSVGATAKAMQPCLMKEGPIEGKMLEYSVRAQEAGHQENINYYYYYLK